MGPPGFSSCTVGTGGARARDGRSPAGSAKAFQCGGGLIQKRAAQASSVPVRTPGFRLRPLLDGSILDGGDSAWSKCRS